MDLPVRYASVFAKGWTSNGYKFMVTPDGREMPVHRYKMEKKLGRRLHVDECVHHINHDKLDNRIENLEVVSRDKHTSHHRTHASPCYVCKKADDKGAHGLCGLHAARVRNFVRKFKVTIPTTPTSQAVFFMSIAKGLEDEAMIPIMERLQLENVVIS